MRKLLGLVLTMLLAGAIHLAAQQSGGGSGTATSVSAAAFPLLAPDGTVAAPSYSWSNSTGSGLYRATDGGQADTYHFAIGGTELFKFTNGSWNGSVPSSGGFFVSRNIVVLNFGDNAGPTNGFVIDSVANRIRVGTNNVLDRLIINSNGLLQLGGNTASFPAIKRNASAINFRLADDSADAAITALSIQTSTVTTVANLPTCNAGAEGTYRAVSDATSTITAGIGAVVAGTGANHVPVYCDGTNWRIN